MAAKNEKEGGLFQQATALLKKAGLWIVSEDHGMDSDPNSDKNMETMVRHLAKTKLPDQKLRHSFSKARMPKKIVDTRHDRLLELAVNLGEFSDMRPPRK